MLLNGCERGVLVPLLVAVLLFSPAAAFPERAPPGDLYVPVGVYEVSVSAPESVGIGEVVEIAVTITVAGVRRTSAWYDVTAVEGVEEVSVSLVEAGLTLVRRPCVTMITNTNLTLLRPSPAYVVNVSSVRYVFSLNTTFLRPGVYTVRVTVKGFRWALVGLAIGYSSFYIEEERSISVRGWPAVEDQLAARVSELESALEALRAEVRGLRDDVARGLSSAVEALKSELDRLATVYEPRMYQLERYLRSELDRLATLLYAVAAVAVASAVTGTAALFARRRR